MVRTSIRELVDVAWEGAGMAILEKLFFNKRRRVSARRERAYWAAHGDHDD